jgi:hypothetical protein
VRFLTSSAPVADNKMLPLCPCSSRASAQR